MKILFFSGLFIIWYTFIGYGIFLFLMIWVKRRLKKIQLKTDAYDLPRCTIVVAAYNEAVIIESKIVNTLGLIYPTGKLKFLFVTDGSTDRTVEIIAEYKEIILLHRDKREGKIAAIHRAVKEVETEIIVFTDANTMLNSNAIIEICKHYADPSIGAVAGEKKVSIEADSDATAGEGFYWKYESKLKKWDAELYSVVGAAGELFSIRKELYKPVPPDSVLDDFMISMSIAERGYRIAYEPKAVATETASVNIAEELKRKIRISAGGIQSIIYLKNLFYIFTNPVLSFQYISHRVLRWTVTPFLLVLVLILNLLLAIRIGGNLFVIIGVCQIVFYLLALGGLILESRSIRLKILFIPFYFCMMNYAVLAGIFRYFRKGQSVTWDKADRKQLPVQ